MSGGRIIHPNEVPRGDERAVAWIYGVKTGGQVNGRPEMHYTVWQLFPPFTLIPKLQYEQTKKVELGDIEDEIEIWHFCRELEPGDIDRVLRFPAGMQRRYCFCIEERGERFVRCYIKPGTVLSVLLDGRRRACENPSKGRIFRAFKSSRVEK